MRSGPSPAVVVLVALGAALITCAVACRRGAESHQDASTITSAASAGPAASPIPVDSAGPASSAADGSATNATGPVFVTSDGRYRVRAPGWKLEKSEYEHTKLRIVRGGQALNLYEEKKMDFTAANIDEFVAHELTSKKTSKPVPTDTIRSLTIGGRTARQVEVEIEMDERRWRELYTVIEFPDAYLEVSAVVKPSEYDKTVILPIVQTIEAVPGKGH